MRVLSSTHGVAVVLLAGALACARNVEETGTARVADTTAVDTAAAADTVQNPPGYRGMERDTTQVPPDQREPVDTFLQQQGTDPAADTAGYGGLERPDTTGMQRDTTPEYQQPTDTAGYQQQPQMDTTGYQQQTDTAGYQPQADTAGYQPGQTGAADSIRLPHDSTRLHEDSAGVTQPDAGEGGQTDQTGEPSGY